MFESWFSGDSRERPRGGADYILLIILSNGEYRLGDYDESMDCVIVQEGSFTIEYPFGRGDVRDSVEWWLEVDYPFGT